MPKVLTKFVNGKTLETYELPKVILQEEVNVHLAAPAAIDWSEYHIMVVNNTLQSENTYPIDNSGSATFVVGYGENYDIVLPVFGEYITPIQRRFTAGQQRRTFRYTYSTGGVMGMDDQRNIYTIEQISALENKSIIKFGVYVDSYLNSAERKDGTGTGCGFCWDLRGNTYCTTAGSWLSANTQLDTSLLPLCGNETIALSQCDGKTDTANIKRLASEAGLYSEMCNNATSNGFKRTIAGVEKVGFVPAYGQIKRLSNNRTQMEALYAAVGRSGVSAPTIWSGDWWTSCQDSATNGVYLYNGGFTSIGGKTYSRSVMVFYDL